MAFWVRCLNCQFVSKHEKRVSLKDRRCGNCGGAKFDIQESPEPTGEPGEDPSARDDQPE